MTSEAIEAREQEAADMIRVSLKLKQLGYGDTAEKVRGDADELLDGIRMEKLVEAAKGVAREFGETVWVALFTGDPDGRDHTGAGPRHEIYYERPISHYYADIHEVESDGTVTLV